MSTFDSWMRCEGDDVQRTASESRLSDIKQSADVQECRPLQLSCDPLTPPAVGGGHYLTSHLWQIDKKRKMVVRRDEQQILVLYYIGRCSQEKNLFYLQSYFLWSSSACVRTYFVYLRPRKALRSHSVLDSRLATHRGAERGKNSQRGASWFSRSSSGPTEWCARNCSLPISSQLNTCGRL